MPEEKPPFDPNKPFEVANAAKGNKPKFNPNEAYTPLDNGPKYKDAFTSVNEEIYSADKKGDKIESAIEFIAKNPLTKGGLLDVDKDALRSVMTNPRASKEQISESIATMQSGNPYYIKNENGVMMPKELKDGAQPPKGRDVQSVWGTQNDANDDSWYTDLGKSLYNGVVGAVEGVAQLGQLGTQLVTGEESQTLGSTINAINSLKLHKNEALNQSMYNTEGIKEWGDLVSKDRFDLSPKALWGTLNSVAESATSFMTGAGAAGNVAKGVQGVEKLAQLSKGGKYASAFTGSFLQMVGDNLDNAREAGLTGRDAGTVALVQTAAQASIDAGFGIESALFNNLIGKGEKEVFKNIVQGVERDAAGKITEEGFKQLAKESATAYTQIAKTGLKEYGKAILKEGGQEVAQDFVAKSAEQLWDKLSDEDKAKFGTNAFDAKSFGQYIQSGLAGMVGGVSMGALNLQAKKKYEEQSANAFKTVQKGEGAVNELKANLNVAKENGSITPEQHNNAVFKIDAYQKYQEQTADLNLDDKQKKEAFELSFNIEALKSEIDVKPEDLAKLDPIAHAKINSKKKLIKGLQEELDKIVLKQDIQTETKAGQKNVDELAKDFEPKKEGEKRSMSLKELNKKLGGLNPKEAEKVDLRQPEVDKREQRLALFNAPTVKYNQMAYSNPTEIKAANQEMLKDKPNNEHRVTIRKALNNRYTLDVGDNKNAWFAQSVKTAGKDNYFFHENLPNSEVIYREDEKGRNNAATYGGDTDLKSEGELIGYYAEPAILKRVEFESKDRNGNPMIKAVLPVYNEQTGKFIGFQKEHRTGKSSYSEEDKVHLNKIIKANWLDKNSLKEYAHIPNRELGVNKSAPKPKEAPTTPVKKEAPAEAKVKKPTLALKEIKGAVLSKPVTIKKVYKGESVDSESNVKNEQSKIVKKFEQLKKVLDCIHG